MWIDVEMLLGDVVVVSLYFFALCFCWQFLTTQQLLPENKKLKTQGGIF